MGVDPTVQVALVSVFSTTIATFGVIAAAFLNTRREKEKLHHVGIEPEDPVNDRNLVDRLLGLLDELQRKEMLIVRLRERIRELLHELREAKAQLKDARTEIRALKRTRGE